MLQTSQSDESIELVRDTNAALFVINLCASTTPVTLAHPASAELKRFTFFVTRRREEGRERFRLHMGYFASLAEADAMLAAVRDVYPAAWAGPAPESRATAARAARPAMTVVPTPPMGVAAPALAPESAVAPASTAIVAAAATAATSTVPVPAVAAPVVAAPARIELESMSNVKAVLAELADTPQKPVAKPVAAMKRAQPPGAALPAVAKAALRPVALPAAAVAPMPRTIVKQAATLTPSETLRVLEAPAPASQPAAASRPARTSASAPIAPIAPSVPGIDFASSSSANNIRVLTPEDTQTLRDIKLEAQRNAPASYAVQLIWAVQPIDTEALPHLAIFDAYTLYHVEGNRQGRRWYGLRLGFFTDAGAAKQVAQYVRSEYTSVAVVPVTGKEKEGARAPTLSAATLQQPAAARHETPKIPTVKPLEKAATGVEGFELLPDGPVVAKRDLDDAPARAAPRATGKAPGKRAVVRPNRKPSPPGAPQPLESTLEILGASTLTIDESREIVNDAAARRAAPKKEKPGRFARLLNRLSDKGG